ncbi:TPA: LPXTG cell wall anchor domain-containing protein, partial [Bacillus thuringiensis]|nr:LPXTG cell wall anchor domain-containing protein [Bacillus thuringiensis]
NTVKNEKIPEDVKEKEKANPSDSDLPQTGQNSTLSIMIGGLVLFNVAAGWFIYNRRKSY